ncbi:L-galactose dehydrogenase (L-GalDH) [Pochonia chlamydosporia 170]|uniref:L-galactose dehydrogenase (L-GalDH) n=1 Tax=Pochonia chlamydosporia 170 TaxID=1380566 RepID=A0A179G840_METCM|nr:L-galactose dehydrogenase (L-GalDH) [Pochonia chlamydosporia 170]OAQ73563.1 L-galactose dehydrogenase (L-GalDH) [Pochonia chlamydosporia 170]
MAQQQKPLSQVLPPLILGTATFNYQYNDDPSQMPYTDIIRKALEHNIAAFDTSPYYGPSEVLLGDALRTLTPPPSRDGYFLITKAGRIAGNEFDYSPAWIRYSVCRSLERLNTPYLDLVYAHDVEFVSPDEVLAAVKELRSLRDQGLIRYVGISGYPVEILASLAETILELTGEPLDAVMSYSHFCIQNSQLGRPDILERFHKAGVDCIPNASMLGMGLITTRGADNGPMASWHPAPPQLRDACNSLAKIAAKSGEHLEEIAIRWALENWAHTGSQFGSVAYPPALLAEARADETGHPARIGVSVMGVSNVRELEETWALWKSVVGLANQADERAAGRRDRINRIVTEQMWPMLGPWKDYAWQSGGETFMNMRKAKGAVPIDAVAQRWGLIPKKFLDSPKI